MAGSKVLVGVIKQFIFLPAELRSAAVVRTCGLLEPLIPEKLSLFHHL